ncbi:L,D-transpeptidase family protein [Streptomyces sp. J2-1]|nr:L,D-transpeptidase family protein [Streptomyces corallincola]
MSLAGCGGSQEKQTAAPGGKKAAAPEKKAPLKRVPGIGDRLWDRVPADSRQVVAVYGAGKDSPDSTVALFTKQGSVWKQERTWSAHNGRKGWTPDHHEGDKRSPVGVFTLSDAGGVLPSPGGRLPYTRSASFQAPHYWNKAYWHDFDYVIAIDYNRVKGTSPNDPTRPQGQTKGGSIWLHMDHGSGTSACVSQPEADMRYLLRTLDPAQHPVVVMGDRAELRA